MADGRLERRDALTRAGEFFDSGAFRDRLSALIAYRSTSQDPGHDADLRRYLEEGLRPWVESMGFVTAIHDNPEPGFGPILTGTRIEDPARPTIILYGHGDTVRGLEDQWSDGIDPWTLTELDGLWYGRGTADNKGQHVLNLTALETVLAARGGKLGFNVKLLIEMAEERGSRGLREFVANHRDMLAADALIASDGPRVEPGLPTIATGTRGTFHFDLVVIGSGPAGQRGAIAAAKLGKRVLVVDSRARVGGVSVHTGTIPSKTLRETVTRSPRARRLLSAAASSSGSNTAGSASRSASQRTRATGSLSSMSLKLLSGERRRPISGVSGRTAASTSNSSRARPAIGPP
jgi:acetylornithine deacetylase/succinyl-diaminopimelate desuccinylase-like protein